MRKINFLLCGLIGLAMTACSGDEPNADGKPDDKGDGQGESFVALNIINANSGPRSRADEPTGTDENGDTAQKEDGSKYEDGTDAENTVTNARCYFFDKDGGAYTVNTTGENWSDFMPTPTSDVDDDNISKICKGTVVMAFDKKDNINDLPKKMVVVINIPDDTTPFDGTLSLTDLKEKLATYSKDELKSFGPGKTGFLMANSVYRTAADGDENPAKLACEIDIPEKAIQTSIELAEENPVDVYVERIAAKLTLAAAAEATDVTDMKFPLYAPTGEEGTSTKFTYNNKEVFAKILGFVPTELTNETYVVKDIDIKWTKESLGFTWNSPSRLRSFWAKSPAFKDANVFPDYKNIRRLINPFSFNDIVTKGLSEKYCLENTLSDNHTKVLVAAQLQDNEGNPIEMAEWNGIRCEKKDLPERIANLLKGNLYTDDKGENAVSANDIDFVAVEQDIEKGRYGVTPKLKEGENITYYEKDTTGKINEVSKENLKKYNATLAKAPTMIWTNGYCYYYVDIKHYGSTGSTGEYGVVRNHVYKTAIEKVVGLGTPVFDPTLEIIPELPAEKYSYIAARISILSWHIVNNSVILGK